MRKLIEFIGIVVFTIILLGIPSLFTLSIVYQWWDGECPIALGILLLIEITFIIGSISDMMDENIMFGVK